MRIRSGICGGKSLGGGKLREVGTDGSFVSLFVSDLFLLGRIAMTEIQTYRQEKDRTIDR
jgi:hypothetical protein